MPRPSAEAASISELVAVRAVRYGRSALVTFVERDAAWETLRAELQQRLGAQGLTTRFCVVESARDAAFGRLQDEQPRLLVALSRTPASFEALLESVRYPVLVLS